MASISEECIVNPRSGDNLFATTSSTGSITMASATILDGSDSLLKTLSMFAPQAGIPPEVFAYRRYQRPEPKASNAGGFRLWFDDLGARRVARWVPFKKGSQ